MVLNETENVSEMLCFVFVSIVGSEKTFLLFRLSIARASLTFYVHTTTEDSTVSFVQLYNFQEQFTLGILIHFSIVGWRFFLFSFF